MGTHLRAALAVRDPEADVTCAGGESGAPFDIRDAGAVDRLVADAKPDAVVHLAAQASVARSIGGSDDTWPVNLGGAINLAAAVARHAPGATVLVASSAEVYGASFLAGPAAEDAPLLPLNPYARSKALAERVFADMLPATVRLIVARPFNHTGAGQREDFVLPSFAGQVARIEAGLQPPVLRVGNLQVRRDFLHVGDVVEAYLRLLEGAETLPRRFTVNVASGEAVLLRDLLEGLRGLASVPFEIEVDPARLRAADIPSASGSPFLLRATTAWRPTRTLPATLADLIADARERCASAGRTGTSSEAEQPR